MVTHHLDGITSSGGNAMRKKDVIDLREEGELEAFRERGFGTAAPLVNPITPALDDDVGPTRFFPSAGGILSLGPFGNNQVAIGVCAVEPRPFETDVTEFHSATGEGILPLDGAVVLHLAPPTSDDEAPDSEKFVAVIVPVLMQVILNEGVWHYAPFALGEEPVSCQILLPVRTYANDCTVENVPAIPFEV